MTTEVAILAIFSLLDAVTVEPVFETFLSIILDIEDSKLSTLAKSTVIPETSGDSVLISTSKSAIDEEAWVNLSSLDDDSVSVLFNIVVKDCI